MLQLLKVLLGQRPSFTGMEDGAPRAKAVHMTTGLAKGWRDVFPERLSSRLNISTDCQLTASVNVKHVTQVAEGSYRLQLIRSNLNQALSGLPSIVPLPHVHLL